MLFSLMGIVMPISGLVVSLAEDSGLRERARAEIAGSPHVQVGESTSRRMAIAVETESRDQDRQFWQWLNMLPGVEFVDVTFVAFDDPQPLDHAPTHMDSTIALPATESHP